ncbi:hypothetical protein [Rivularia sp. UHCC 0363]|uniref:hypothetical protein n=1 Tax=Rivularia sp. UHCC 0363 TaxID=3110244 RepID=UPI002B202A0A|nr:hypothetical protein [Rivularia sp. UHCC 0363]MEA5596130.1 hypothetical protein [Rivularia sp. UHCC 0363]
MSDIYNLTKWKLKTFLTKLSQNHRIALASFPRSGNTWFRFLIEESTGVKTGSIYDDRVMTRGLEGIVIKTTTHQLDSSRYTKAIHIIRNPFDAIESYYSWKIKGINL